MALRIVKSDIWEGGVVSTKARIIRPNDAALTSADVTGTSLWVYNTTLGTSAPGTSIYFTSLASPFGTVAAYATSGWTQDSTGYNWTHDFATATLSINGGQLLRLEYAIATTDGPVDIVHEVNVGALYHR